MHANIYPSDLWLRRCEGSRPHDVVDTEDRSNVYTSVDVAATVQRIENDAVLPPIAVLDNDSFFVLFRDENGGFSGGPETVDHDIVGQHVKFLLFLPLNVRLTSQPDTM